MWKPKAMPPRRPKLVALLEANRARLRVEARRKVRQLLIRHGIDPAVIFADQFEGIAWPKVKIIATGCK